MVTIKRERFIVFKIYSNDAEISLSSLRYSIWTKFQTLYGLDYTTRSGLYFVEYNENKKIGLLRCAHTVLEKLITSMALISRIDKSEVIISPVFITGLLNKAKKYFQSLTEEPTQ